MGFQNMKQQLNLAYIVSNYLFEKCVVNDIIFLYPQGAKGQKGEAGPGIYVEGPPGAVGEAVSFDTII